MTDDQHGESTPRGGSRWDPLPQGDYDDGATAFVHLPEGGIDALLASQDSPLAAPGHGYVPPQITVTPATTAGTDPAATWPVAGAPVDGAQWHDPNATGQDTAGGDRFTYRPDASGQWQFQDGGAASPEEQHPPAPGHDVTGQWSIPVAGGDLPDESGEFTASALVEQWGGTPPPTLPGGAAAPWATQPMGEPWGAGEGPADYGQGQEPGAVGQPADYGQGPVAEHEHGHGHPVGEQPYGQPDPAGQHLPPHRPEAAQGQPYGGEPYRQDEGGLGQQPVPGYEHEHAPVQQPAPAEHAGDYGAQQHAAGQHTGGQHAGDPAAEQHGDGHHAGGHHAVDHHAGGRHAGGHAAEQAGGPAEQHGAEHHLGEHAAEQHAGEHHAAEPHASDPAAEHHAAPASAEQAPPHPADAYPAEPSGEQPEPQASQQAPDAGEVAEDAQGGPGEAAESPAEASAEPSGEAEAESSPEAAEEAATAAGPETPDEPAPQAETAAEAEATDAPGPAAAPNEDHPLASYVLRVNGTDRPVADAWIGESLLYVLRERLGLAGAKDGCSQGECGACNVQVDGRLVASCLVPAVTAAGSEVRTVEGLASDGQPSDVQRALARCGAVQCGFCVPGMAMTVHDLLEGNPAPSELETRQALCGNLCRCSGYRGVVEAVKEVVAEREAHRASDGADTDAGEARIPHQAGPGAGGIHSAAFDGPQPGRGGPHDQSHGQDGGHA
ncbi:2Fe-2S iron-sulfur cluster-binding protein [Streptomyces sp. NPDC051207]|uniref:2Fe-2S iron-sulfur cluster-binding protein n=1 Tax=Streptomyces sp. NPDC051207 TaxID=3154641 RepID=UPI003438101C